VIFPPDFTHPEGKTAVAKIAAGVITTLSVAHRGVVQAGGCSGLWPLALAKYFKQVYTFEPAPINFRCLQANVALTGNIAAFPCALGETRQRVGMTRPKVGAGLWRVDGDGDVEMETLDDVLGDAVVDAIVLDVEGHEVQALKGAERIITRCRPLLWFEFMNNTAEIHDFLADHGYTVPVRGVGGDCYSMHVTHC
jgi:FkbM family methyltransferase